MIHTTRSEWEFTRLHGPPDRGRVVCSCTYASEWSSSIETVVELHAKHRAKHHAELAPRFRVPFVPSLVELRAAVLSLEPFAEPPEPLIAADDGPELDLELELSLAEGGEAELQAFLDELRHG